MTSRQRNVQSACPVCGASLPHTTPMSREYHEGVLRRSGGHTMSLEQQVDWCQEHHATIQFDSSFVRVRAEGHTGVSGSLEAAIQVTINQIADQ